MNGIVADFGPHEIYQWSWLFNRSDAFIQQIPFECNLPGLRLAAGHSLVNKAFEELSLFLHIGQPT